MGKHIMNEFLPTNEAKKDELYNNEANKRFIAAILGQALTDACSYQRINDPEGARRFINSKNPIFQHYCELLDMNPDWVAKNMRKEIERWDNRKRECSPYLFSKLKIKENDEKPLPRSQPTSNLHK